MFKFREIREIKPDETRKVVDKKEEGYLKIKPGSKMTYEEAKNFVNSLFVPEESR